MKNKSIIIGLLGGVAVGAVLGILFAPDKGTNTRKKISKKGQDLKDNLTDVANKYVSKITETVESYKNESQSN